MLYVYFADLAFYVNGALFVKYSGSRLPVTCHDSSWEYRIMKSAFLICNCEAGIECAVLRLFIMHAPRVSHLQ